jgi:hypothetical protein
MRRASGGIATKPKLRKIKAAKQERLMGAVMVRCPQTGRELSTGLVADRERFRTMPVFFGQVYCPVCRTEHEWFAKEAWVCESEPDARQAFARLS